MQVLDSTVLDSSLKKAIALNFESERTKTSSKMLNDEDCAYMNDQK